MNKLELITELNLLNIDSNTYSLDGDLIPDSIVLYNSYQNWEVFYLDERGGRSDMKKFSSEDQACNYMLRILKEAKEVEIMFNLNTSPGNPFSDKS